MKTSWSALLLVLAACSAAPVVPGAGPAGSANCPLEFLYKAPDRPYEPLGDLLDHVRSPPPGGAVEALRPKACALGADAVIVRRNQVLNELGHALVEGTAIRYVRTPPQAPSPERGPPPPEPNPQPQPQPPEPPPQPEPNLQP